MTPRHSFHLWKPLAAALGASLVALLLRDFPADQQAVGTIFAATVILWATEAFPVGITALSGMVMLALFGGVGQDRAFAGLGDPVIPLFIGSLILAKAMEVTGLSKRVALKLLSKPWPTKNPSRILLAICALTASASLFLSNTATVATMFPIALSILKVLDTDGPSHGFAAALMLSLTFAANVTVGTPVGTPPDLIAVDQIDEVARIDIGFVEWMAFGIPITLLMLGAVWLVMRRMTGRPAPATAQANEQCAEQLAALGRPSPAERATVWVLGIAILLWVAPPILAPMLKPMIPGFSTWLIERLSANVAGVLAALLLFAIPAKGAPGGHAITWKDAAQIDWGIILLLAGGLSLGTALFECGLARNLGQSLTAATGATSLWTITALCIALSIAVSEFASNTATATALLPVAIGLAESAHVAPAGPALGVALGASMGFALPFSTATNAIVYSSGLVPQSKMIRAGLMLDAIAFFVIFGVLWLVLPLLGLT